MKHDSLIANLTIRLLRTNAFRAVNFAFILIFILQTSLPAWAIQGRGNRGSQTKQVYAVPDSVTSDNRKQACEAFVNPRCTGKASDRLGELLQASCKATRESNHCDDLEKNVTDRSVLLSCEPKDICTSTVADMSVGDCIINGVKISGEMLADMNPIKMASELYNGLSDGFAKAASCYENKDGEKDKMIEAYEAMVDPRLPQYHLSEGARQAMLQNFTCAQMAANFEGRLRSQQNIVIANMQAGKFAPPANSSADHQKYSLAQAIEKIQAEMGLPLQCYTPKAKAELACSVATTALIMAGVTIISGAAASMAIRTLKTQLAKYGASRAASMRVLDAIASGSKIELADAGAMSEFGRLESAAKLLGHPLTSAERKAVLDAHLVGADSGAGYGTYTQAQIREKLEILKNAGFSTEERELLMRNGITGQAPAQGQTISLNSQQAQTRFSALQEKAKAGRQSADAQYMRDVDTRQFADANKTLTDSTARPADRMNAARIAGEQARKYGDEEMARSFGARGLAEARKAYEAAKLDQSKLTMQQFLDQKGSNFAANYQSSANLAGDRQAMADAAGSMIRYETAQANRIPGANASPSIKPADAAIVRVVQMQESWSQQTTAREAFRALTPQQQNQAYLTTLRDRLAVLEGSGVADGNSTLEQVRKEIRRLDPAYLEPKP